MSTQSYCRGICLYVFNEIPYRSSEAHCPTVSAQCIRAPGESGRETRAPLTLHPDVLQGLGESDGNRICNIPLRRCRHRTTKEAVLFLLSLSLCSPFSQGAALAVHSRTFLPQGPVDHKCHSRQLGDTLKPRAAVLTWAAQHADPISWQRERWRQKIAATVEKTQRLHNKPTPRHRL